MSRRRAIMLDQIKDQGYSDGVIFKTGHHKKIADLGDRCLVRFADGREIEGMNDFTLIINSDGTSRIATPEEENEIEQRDRLAKAESDAKFYNVVVWLVSVLAIVGWTLWGLGI